MTDVTIPLLVDEGGEERGESHESENTSNEISFNGDSNARIKMSRVAPFGDAHLGQSKSFASGHGAPQQQERMFRTSRSMKKHSGAIPRARRLTWICIDSDGNKRLINADKRAMIAKTGLSIPIRDMRLLDFNLAQNDSTILVRDNAIIASLEHARVIIMADKAIIPRQTEEQNPLASRFLDMLEESIAEWIKQKQEFEKHMENSESIGGYEYEKTSSLTGFGGHKDHEDASSVSTLQQDLQPLPFELVVLESALKEVIASIGHLNTEIEGIITHALDSLLKSISPNNLERVRKVKTRLQRLSLRCEGLRDELQRFLHDDDDMAKMCLTRRKEIEDEVVKAANQSVESEMPERQSMPLGSFRRSYLSRHSQMFASSGASPGQMSAGQGPGALTASLAQEEDAEADSEAQMEVENLLESYYMEVDAMYDKLVSIEEYIKDTEEYINIELDSSRNRLIRMDIILSVATFAIMPFNLLAGILGENLVIPQQITKSVSEFFGVNAIAAAVCLIVFYSLMLYMKVTKLI
eukprot:jgi/Picsp_1/1196/NSC_04677-R1_rna splicing protein